jgi:hypothetical protein
VEDDGLVACLEHGEACCFDDAGDAAGIEVVVDDGDFHGAGGFFGKS